MNIEIRSDKVIIDGYVNAVERNSKPLQSRIGSFIERVCAGAFNKALKRNDNVRILLNHDWDRDVGGTKTGELELKEDNIGLNAHAEITDPELIEIARRGDLVGWSFGFEDVPGEVEMLLDNETNLPLRKLHDLDLWEVSLLSRDKTPAYNGTLVNVRAEDDKTIYCGADNMPDDINTREDAANVPDEPEPAPAGNEPEPAKDPEKNKVTSEYYASYKNMIAEMRN